MSRRIHTIDCPQTADLWGAVHVEVMDDDLHEDLRRARLRIVADRSDDKWQTPWETAEELRYTLGLMLRAISHFTGDDTMGSTAHDVAKRLAEGRIDAAAEALGAACQVA